VDCLYVIDGDGMGLLAYFTASAVIGCVENR
jgi:hypothetical protein